MESSLLPVAMLLLGGGGIGTVLGLVVQRQNNRATQTATAVAQAVDGLVKLNERQSAELDRLNALLVQRDARIAELEAAYRKPRRGT